MKINRRTFMQSGAVTIAALSTFNDPQPVQAGQYKASDLMEMGRTRMKVSRLGFGVGDGRGKVFQNMEQENFTSLIRYALDQGVRYFDMDPSHIHQMMGEALKGVDRDQYTLVTGISRPDPDELPALIPRYLKELNVDYIDGVLIIAIGKADWADEFKAYRDLLSEAKEKGYIKACGVSVHGLEGLQTLSDDPWVDFAMVSCNHKGIWMDAPYGMKVQNLERREYSMPVIKQIHRAGIGIASMKTFAANGFDSAEERLNSIRFILKSGSIDTMPIGFQCKEHLDEVVNMFMQV